MDPIEVASSKVSRGCRGSDLAVEGIAGLNFDFFPGSRFNHGRDPFVPAIMAPTGFLG
jgi:hypothetical protein